MSQMSESIEGVNTAIQNAAKDSGRNPEEITLVAASKTTGIHQIREAIQWGVRTFGENRVQEGVTKFLNSDLIKEIDSLHLIGPLQTNKIKKVVGRFDLIHSVDSLRLAEKIEEEAERQAITQSILLQVNIAGEKSKHGISAKEAPSLVKRIQSYPHLSLLGLMTLPPPVNNAEEVRPYFTTLRRLGHLLGLYQFSMGMSSDFIVAIEEGATWVRIGTAIFGERTY